jgi:hypothetical protein
VLLLLVCLLVAPVVPAAGQAQPGAADVRGLRLEVDELAGVVQPGGSFAVRALVHNASGFARDGVRLVVTVHQRTAERWRYQQALDDGVLGDVVHAFAEDLDQLPADGARVVELSETVAELGFTQPATQAGVYPVRLRLQVGAEVAAEHMSSLVLAPEGVAEPVRVALLAPFAAPPARRADGAVTDPALAPALATSGTLGGLASELGAAGELPLTVALDGLTLESAAQLQAGFVDATRRESSARGSGSLPARQAGALLEVMAAVTARRHVETLALPFASADLVALVRAGMRGEALRQVTDGVDAVERTLATTPTARILWPPDGLDVETLFELPATGVEAVVLSETTLVRPRRTEVSPAPVRELRTSSGGSFTALVGDPWLEETLEEWSNAAPALTAQRLIGELATVYFERPSTPRRGVLLAPRSPQRPLPPGLLRALSRQLDGARIVEPVTLSTLARTTTPEPAAARLAYPSEARERELDPAYVAALSAARTKVGSLEGVLTQDRSTPGRLDRILLQAGSVHFRGDGAEGGLDLIRTVRDTVDDLYATVSVVDSAPLTLTSVEEELPVAVRSDAQVPLRVRVSLQSDRYQVDGAGFREVVLAPGETQLLTFRVRAVAPGATAPVRVVVSDPDGVLPLAAGTMVVRSTAFSPVAMTLTAGALVFLLVWWVRDARRRRRSRVAEHAKQPVPAA